MILQSPRVVLKRNRNRRVASSLLENFFSPFLEHEKKKKKGKIAGKQQFRHQFSQQGHSFDARVYSLREIQARASVSRATAARPPDRHFLPRHVASRGRARRICTSTAPLPSIRANRRASGRFLKTSPSPRDVSSGYTTSPLVLSLIVSPHFHLVSSYPLPLPPFRSQFLRERTPPFHFVRLVTLHHSSPFNSSSPVDLLQFVVSFLLPPLEISFVQIFFFFKERGCRGGG